jgi:Transposase DDE domain
MVFALGRLHTQHATAALIHHAGACYVITVKGNQPTLLAAATDRLSGPPEVLARQRHGGHRRTEERLLHTSPAAGTDRPGAPGCSGSSATPSARKHADGQRTGKEVVHGITHLTAEQADPDQLAALARGHWPIESSIHRVRDPTDREDANRGRTGNGTRRRGRHPPTSTPPRSACPEPSTSPPPDALRPSTPAQPSDSSPEDATRTNVRYDRALGRRRSPSSAGRTRVRTTYRNRLPP